MLDVSITMRCLTAYETDLVDQGNWLPGWERTLNDTEIGQTPYPALDMAYMFQSEADLNARPYWAEVYWYSGGGFIANLGNTIQVKV